MAKLKLLKGSFKDAVALDSGYGYGYGSGIDYGSGIGYGSIDNNGLEEINNV